MWSEVTENYSQEPQGNASTTPSITNIVLQDLSFVDCKLTSLFDGLPGVCARQCVLCAQGGDSTLLASRPQLTNSVMCVYL